MGAGRVAKIVSGGWAEAGFTPGTVVAYDPDASVTHALRAQHAGVDEADLERAAKARIVFVAVHPPVAKAAFEALAPHLGEDTIVVSCVPSMRIDELAPILGRGRTIARLIPNAPSIVGAGFNPVAFNPMAMADDIESVSRMLEPLGQHPIVNDDDLEAYAIITAMGPTYLWPQFYGLEALACQLGLAPDASRQAVRAMVTGSLETMPAGSVDAVMDLIPARPLSGVVDQVVAAFGDTLAARHRALTARE